MAPCVPRRNSLGQLDAIDPASFSPTTFKKIVQVDDPASFPATQQQAKPKVDNSDSLSLSSRRRFRGRTIQNNNTSTGSNARTDVASLSPRKMKVRVKVTHVSTVPAPGLIQPKKSEASQGTVHSNSTGSNHVTSVIRNFRPARCLNGLVYRCGRPDDLVHRLDMEDDWTESEELLLRQAGLLIDLRSSVERSSRRAEGWMSKAPGGPFKVCRGTFDATNPAPRKALYVDVMEPERFMKYVDTNWMTSEQKAQLSFMKMINDHSTVHSTRMAALNKRGLFGMYEVILETSHNEYFQALKAMTLHAEGSQQDSPVIVFCVHGKDRTGLFIMLCQSILGVSDKDIIEDYHLSDKNADPTKSTIPTLKPSSVKQSFAGAPKEIMEQTLEYIRSKWGSVSPNYLDTIGFDESWRQRFMKAYSKRDFKPVVFPSDELTEAVRVEL